MSVSDTLDVQLELLRKSRLVLSSSSLGDRNAALMLVADALEREKEYLFQENRRDLDASAGRLSDQMLHRLAFTEDKLESVVNGLKDLVGLPDPVSRTLEKRMLDDGFILERRSFPIGTIAMIFEARPDALVQMAGLALKSGNAIVLKGGSEAACSNRALVKVIKNALDGSAVGNGWLLQIESHGDVDAILRKDDYIDLVIPRGSNAFVRHVMENTDIPVLGHADGLCSIYVDKSADVDLAVKVAVDSKVQYPAACNAVETVLVDSGIAERFLPPFAKALKPYGVLIHGDERTGSIIDCLKAEEKDFDTEFLALELAVKVVDSLDEAIAHIMAHGSGHTDCIITGDDEARDRFFNMVDSADVFCNCSTRFADGFRFGLGAEVGISTGKIHARGPVGLSGLMSSKWLLTGHGETVAEYSGKNGRKFKHKDIL